MELISFVQIRVHSWQQITVGHGKVIILWYALSLFMFQANGMKRNYKHH